MPRLTALWGEVVGCIVWGSALLWVTIQPTVFPEVAATPPMDSARDPGWGGQQPCWGGGRGCPPLGLVGLPSTCCATWAGALTLLGFVFLICEMGTNED